MAPRVLNRIQQELEHLYRLDVALDVRSFVRPRSEVDPQTDRPEQVLVRQTPDALEMALVMEDALLEPDAHWTLDRFCAAAEGVSHLLYLMLVAQRNGQVRRLELELQAEIDKFALLLFGGVEPADAMVRLFRSFTLRDSVSEDGEQDRYLEANRLAHNYCGWLVSRFVDRARTEPLLAELRRVYRMGGERKLGYVSECRP